MSQTGGMTANAIVRWFDQTLFDLGRQFRWSYLPPLMVYLAAGVSGLTSIVGAFFVKDYLGLSAAFLAGIGFWAGIPWALKMPLGHLVDLIWRWKSLLIYVGASLIALSIVIMYGLIIHTDMMSQVMDVEAWYVLSVLLAPVGYVVQDVVADAMTVEAVPTRVGVPSLGIAGKWCVRVRAGGGAPCVARGRQRSVCDPRTGGRRPQAAGIHRQCSGRIAPCWLLHGSDVSVYIADGPATCY